MALNIFRLRFRRKLRKATPKLKKLKSEISGFKELSLEERQIDSVSIEYFPADGPTPLSLGQT
jgi:hypothetical protein